MCKREVKKLLKNKKREITLILISIMVLGLFFSGSSMGKQFSTTNIETNGKIAEPIITVENSPVIKMDGKKEREYYNFKIKNYKEKGEVTQIEMVYNLEILFQTEEAISFKLYKGNEEVLLENNKTTDMKLKKEIGQEDDYQLEIIYDKTKNYSSDDILQDVQIKVHSEQVKV